MRAVRFHPQQDPFASAAGAGPRDGSSARLNLLLSDASTKPHADADTWAARLPRLLEPMGVRSHHAASGRQASDLMAATQIHVAVVDLGLPLDTPAVTPDCSPTPSQEAGWRLLEVLARLAHRPPTVAITNAKTRRDEARQLSAALRLGAFAVIDRPRSTRDVETLLELLRRCITRHYRDRWPT
ncbi:MAG: response regulator [Planctomycetota bacterium]